MNTQLGVGLTKRQRHGIIKPMDIPKSPKNKIFTINKVIAIFFAITLFFSCKNDVQQINSLTDIQNFPNQSAKNIEIIYSDSARVKMKIIAPELNRYTNTKEPYIDFPSGITVYFYTVDQKIESSLTANKAIYYEIPDKWEASNDVVVVNKEGEILNTELIIWDRKKEMLYSDKFVKITRKDEIWYGKGFEANENFTNYTILEPSGEINLDQ